MFRNILLRQQSSRETAYETPNPQDTQNVRNLTPAPPPLL